MLGAVFVHHHLVRRLDWGSLMCGDAFDRRIETRDQRVIVPLRFLARLFQRRENGLDGIDRGQRFGHHVRCHLGLAVANLSKHGLGRMRELLEPRKVQEAARALDRMHQAEDVVEDVAVARIALEDHDLIVHGLQAFCSFRQEIAEQLVHSPLVPPAQDQATPAMSLAAHPGL